MRQPMRIQEKELQMNDIEHITPPMMDIECIHCIHGNQKVVSLGFLPPLMTL